MSKTEGAFLKGEHIPPSSNSCPLESLLHAFRYTPTAPGIAEAFRHKYISILKFPRGAYEALHSLQLRGYLGPREHRTCRKIIALRAKPLPCTQNHRPERSKQLLEPPLGAPGRSKWLLEPWLSAPRRSKWVFEPLFGIPRALKVVV